MGYAGIRLQMHEAPYLRGGNSVRLSIGNTFSNEPGIHNPGEVGFPSFCSFYSARRHLKRSESV